MTADITLYTAGTPNGWKASILLEELGLPYKLKAISLSKQEQKEEWFLKVNPNGRIPAITDGDFNVFESGAILIYLCETYDKNHEFLSEDPHVRSETIQWIMWQMGGLGPMMGQANHFVRYAPEQIPYGIKRYTDESLRLLSVMERQLSDGRPFLVGDYSIADICAFGWVAIHGYPKLDISGMPNLNAWLRRVGARPAVKRGLDVPTKSDLIDNDFKIPDDQAKKTAEEGKKLIQQQLSSQK